MMKNAKIKGELRMKMLEDPTEGNKFSYINREEEKKGVEGKKRTFNNEKSKD